MDDGEPPHLEVVCLSDPRRICAELKDGRLRRLVCVISELGHCWDDTETQRLSTFHADVLVLLFAVIRVKTQVKRAFVCTWHKSASQVTGYNEERNTIKFSRSTWGPVVAETSTVTRTQPCVSIQEKAVVSLFLETLLFDKFLQALELDSCHWASSKIRKDEKNEIEGERKSAGKEKEREGMGWREEMEERGRDGILTLLSLSLSLSLVLSTALKSIRCCRVQMRLTRIKIWKGLTDNVRGPHGALVIYDFSVLKPGNRQTCRTILNQCVATFCASLPPSWRWCQNYTSW